MEKGGLKYVGGYIVREFSHYELLGKKVEKGDEYGEKWVASCTKVPNFGRNCSPWKEWLSFYHGEVGLVYRRNYVSNVCVGGEGGFRNMYRYQM